MIAKFRPLILSATVVAVAGIATIAWARQPADTSPPVAAVPLSHYSGTWLEIGRRPMTLTNNCVAGWTTYAPGNKPNEYAVEDGCRKDTPSGKPKTIKGRGELLDAGTTNARLRVHYPFFITWEYRVLYEAPDNNWFISADPKMKNLWIYARTVPSPEARQVMVNKAQSLGYDVSQLEFPAF